MPDPAKFDALRRAGFRIRAACDNCVHARFDGSGRWGRCGAHTYTHGKHVGTQQTPIVRTGYCPTHGWIPAVLAELSSLAAFVDDPEAPG